MRNARVGNWMIAVGALTIFFALCGLSAALSSRSDSAMVAVSAAVFSLGALAIAGGVYINAAALKSQAGSAEIASPARRRSRGGCELCGSDVPVIQCRVHQLHLCATCLAEHYDARSCSFIPPTRRPKGMAKARGA